MKFKPSPPLLLFRRLVRSIQFNGPGGAIAHSYRRLIRSLSNHGLRGTLDRAFHKAPVAPPRQVPNLPHPFDLLHGTDTGGYISGADLSANSLSNLFSTAYLGVEPAPLTQALAALPLQLDQCTFVDLGAGKGRALMVAAQFPFLHLVGVEFVPELCTIAEANFALRPEWAARISIVCQDAANFSYPETPLVIFLFDPFLDPVLRRVLANLQRQLRRSPRPTYLLYAHKPRYVNALEKFPFLRELLNDAYPLTPEEAAADPLGRTHERITIYTADLSR